MNTAHLLDNLVRTVSAFVAGALAYRAYTRYRDDQRQQAKHDHPANFYKAVK